jgi:hypothetical protein
MPVSPLGQTYTFAIERSDDVNVEWIWHNVKRGETVARIAADRGHPELARSIASANGIRDVRSPLGRSRVRVPGKARGADTFNVLAGDEGPRIVAGYAELDVVDRPGRTGLSVFRGYQPLRMEIDVVFMSMDTASGWRNKESADVEEGIRLLERMAGRGRGLNGAGSSPPPVIRVSTTNSAGTTVPLIPHNYQSSPVNTSAPLWRVADIDPGTVWRNRYGGRIRWETTITLQQHIKVNLISRSASERAAGRRGKGTLQSQLIGIDRAVT